MKKYEIEYTNNLTNLFKKFVYKVNKTVMKRT